MEDKEKLKSRLVCFCFLHSAMRLLEKAAESQCSHGNGHSGGQIEFSLNIRCPEVDTPGPGEPQSCTAPMFTCSNTPEFNEWIKKQCGNPDKTPLITIRHIEQMRGCSPPRPGAPTSKVAQVVCQPVPWLLDSNTPFLKNGEKSQMSRLDRWSSPSSDGLRGEEDDVLITWNKPLR